jgi:hypothetical protein
MWEAALELPAPKDTDVVSGGGAARESNRPSGDGVQGRRVAFILTASRRMHTPSKRTRGFLLPVAQVGADPLRWAVVASIAVHLAGVGLAIGFPSERPVSRMDTVSTIRHVELGLWEERRGPAGAGPLTVRSPPEGPGNQISTSARAASAEIHVSPTVPPSAPLPYGPRRSAPGMWGLEAVETVPGPPAFRGQFTAEVRALNDSLAVAASEPEPGWGVDDGSRGKLGVSASRLYLGSFSVPLRTDGQLIFSDPREPDPQRRIERALDERTRVQDALQDRARSIRARRDSIRAGGGR